MRPGWTTFCLCVSLLRPGHGLLVGGPHGALQAAPHVAAHGFNETLLAGLRPGRDTFAMAEKRFKAKNLTEDRGTEYKQWRDACSGRSIRLELDAKSVIQSITVTTLDPKKGPCGDQLASFLDSKYWVTGHGLRMGDPQDRITELYGEPNSSGPSTKNGQELEMLFYQFDWAGSDVPQVMEVLCARDTGRVAEITLAFPSL